MKGGASMQTITITNQKGGVGKTTTAFILCCGLIKRGYKVLSIDADPQTNLSYTAGFMEDNEEYNLYRLFKNKELSSLQVIQKTDLKFDLIPGSLNLAGADLEFNQTGREYILKKIIEPLKNNYDFCVIDTPPTLGILTINALTASDSIIIPMKADIYSIQGFSQLLGMVKNVKEYTNQNLKVDGLLINQYSNRAVLNRNFNNSIEDVAKQLNIDVYKSKIRDSVIVREMAFTTKNIFDEQSKSNIADDYNGFINEFLEKRGFNK